MKNLKIFFLFISLTLAGCDDLFEAASGGFMLLVLFIGGPLFLLFIGSMAFAPKDKNREAMFGSRGENLVAFCLLLLFMIGIYYGSCSGK